MLHGLRQVNIAPCRKKAMQYEETDRQERRRQWHDQRDDGTSANVPYQEGQFQEGKQKCLQMIIPNDPIRPIQRNLTVSTLWNLETPS